MLKIALSVPFILGGIISSSSAQILSTSEGRSIQVAQAMPSIVETDGFRFQLVGCEENPNVREPYRCNFLVENIGNRSREISIYGDVAPANTSSLNDSQGQQIFATSVTVAGTSQTYYAGTNSRPGVPFRASIFYEAIPDGDVRFIDVSCVALGGARAYFRAEFLAQ